MLELCQLLFGGLFTEAGALHQGTFLATLSIKRKLLDWTELIGLDFASVVCILFTKLSKTGRSDVLNNKFF